MMDEKSFGFTEIAHTADWSLKVWAPDLPLLFTQCAEGMYWLMQASLRAAPRVQRALDLQGEDLETLLVSFLSELLYLGESEGLGFDQFQLTLSGNRLQAALTGAPIAEWKKEIKAVTFHNLAVNPTRTGYTVTIVFDV
jgi:SHS2 domain-containing protein